MHGSDWTANYGVISILGVTLGSEYFMTDATHYSRIFDVANCYLFFQIF